MRLLILLSIILPVLASAQAKKYVNYINPQTARKHLEYLASDELEGRETGQKGQKLAGAYLMQNFIEYGLPPVNGNYFQRFNLKVGNPEKIKIIIDNDTLYHFEDFIHNSDFQNVNFNNAKSVFVGYGIESENYNEFKNIDVKDKVVFLLENEPKDKKGKYYVTNNTNNSDWNNRKAKINNLKQKGAKAIIMVNKNVEMYKSSFAHAFKSSKMKLATDSFSMKIPLVFISEKKADAILKEGGLETGFRKTTKKILKNGKPLSKDLSFKIGIESEIINDKITSENVLGFVEGSDKKDEIIIVTAHYDHLGVHNNKIFNGADDDGSGTTALLMMAEAFAKAKAAGKGPRRSILFMPLSAEEKGLLGSRYYSENPVFPLKNTVANLNIDMIGRVDKAHHNKKGVPNPNYVYVIGSHFLSKELHEINEDQNNKYTKLDLDYTFNTKDDPNRFYFRSDHYNFAKNNIPCIFYFNGTHEDYHQHTDTVDKIDFTKLSNITKLIYHTAWELANRENRIKLSEN